VCLCSHLVVIRVSTEVTFWHSAEYGSDFRLNSGEIPRNSAEFRGISPELSRNHFRSQKIPRNSVSAEFRGHPSCDDGLCCGVHNGPVDGGHCGIAATGRLEGLEGGGRLPVYKSVYSHLVVMTA
jgi:hypothetical protein